MFDRVLNASLRSPYFTLKNVWVKVFRNGPNKNCGRQPLKIFKWYGLPKQTKSLQIFKGCHPQVLLGPFLNTLTHIRSWGNSSGRHVQHYVALQIMAKCFCFSLKKDETLEKSPGKFEESLQLLLGNVRWKEVAFLLWYATKYFRMSFFLH